MKHTWTNGLGQFLYVDYVYMKLIIQIGFIFITPCTSLVSENKTKTSLHLVFKNDTLRRFML